MFWTSPTLAAGVAARWLTPTREFTLSPGVCTDTRAIDASKLFIALRGEKHDAHAFLSQVVAAKSQLIVIDREDAFATIRESAALANTSVLLVHDTAAALLSLAKAYREYLGTHGTTFVAVGGSNGKTSTVRMLQAVLSQSLRGSSSQKSFNNAIGVPLTILAAREDDQFVICEVGTNAPGELEPLSRTVQPDIVVLTSLGREHLEGLGSLEGVAQEEAQLVTGIKTSGTIVTPADAPADLLLTAIHATLAREGKHSRVMTFGTSANADTLITSREQSFEGVDFGLADGTVFSLPVLGLHNATNAAAAITVARVLNLPDAANREGLKLVQPPAMRLQPHTIATTTGSIRVINDAYNANPDSMLAAIATVREIAWAMSRQASSVSANGSKPRLVLVLGDMLELGVHGPQLHAESIAAAMATKPDVLVLLGPIMCAAVPAARKMRASEDETNLVTHASTSLDACQAIAAMLRAGDLVLLKGSRGTAVERVLTALQAQHASGVSAGRGELKPFAPAKM
jgi:UDP-N-acetylmuramoyl-tripeptide--D-alanyl-D-alanine ligase